jgi:uncharacterized protein (TIGR03067 family)
MKRLFTLKIGLALIGVCCLVVPWPSARAVAPAPETNDKAKAVKKELAALKGTWKLITHVEGGRVVEYDNPQLYTFADDKLTVKRGDQVIAEGPIDLDPTKVPKHLDFRLTSGQTDLTIYIREGDHLIQCGCRDGKTRPSEFAAGTANGGEYLIVLKREK